MGVKEKEALLFICGLISLCDFSQMHIKLFRTPKGEIFQKFSDEYLERIGFLTYIREGETQKALALVRGVAMNIGVRLSLKLWFSLDLCPGMGLLGPMALLC